MPHPVLCPTGRPHAWQYTARGEHVSVIECAACGSWGIAQKDNGGHLTVDDVWPVPGEKHARNLALGIEGGK